MNILIVDDDEIARMSLANILHGLGQVALAEDGEEAWEKLQGGLRPEVCCCDINMPRLDGLGLMQRVRAHPVLHDLPFVLISAASDRQTVQNAIAGGVAGYILKPYLAVQTRTLVERVLRERRASESENVLVTRRRLAIGADQLGGLLGKLRDDAAECAAALAAGGDTDARLQRLYSGTLVLGLWRGTALLKDLLSRGPAGAARAKLTLDELLRLVERQLRELGAAPAHAA
ncbi:response regulator transcription factor [Ramlibacter humi]|uniref:Response regulator n=1 Tax=Ramlibacter humi TaxID=2530451 RepID=A0A4Z0CDJ7_9BURK|nr:response regulator [Ramlibacter humi]TFZ08385.1 response regulator [Ramlibacter humi]